MKAFGSETGHRPENLAVGGALTAAAFFCVALVATLAKVAGQYTSTGVLLLFQNLICLAVHGAGRGARRMAAAAHEQDRPAHPACSGRNRMLVRAVRRNHHDSAGQRDAADLQRSAVDAAHRMGRHATTGREGDVDRRSHRVRRRDPGAAAPNSQFQHRPGLRAHRRADVGGRDDDGSLVGRNRTRHQDPRLLLPALDADDDPHRCHSIGSRFRRRPGGG